MLRDIIDAARYILSRAGVLVGIVLIIVTAAFALVSLGLEERTTVVIVMVTAALIAAIAFRVWDTRTKRNVREDDY